MMDADRERSLGLEICSPVGSCGEGSANVPCDQHLVHPWSLPGLFLPCSAYTMQKFKRGPFKYWWTSKVGQRRAGWHGGWHGKQAESGESRSLPTLCLAYKRGKRGWLHIEVRQTTAMHVNQVMWMQLFGSHVKCHFCPKKRADDTFPFEIKVHQSMTGAFGNVRHPQQRRQGVAGA